MYGNTVCELNLCLFVYCSSLIIINRKQKRDETTLKGKIQSNGSIGFSIFYIIAYNPNGFLEIFKKMTFGLMCNTAHYHMTRTAPRALSLQNH